MMDSRRIFIYCGIFDIAYFRTKNLFDVRSSFHPHMIDFKSIQMCFFFSAHTPNNFTLPCETISKFVENCSTYNFHKIGNNHFNMLRKKYAHFENENIIYSSTNKREHYEGDKKFHYQNANSYQV
jgi:hypothetical protein